MHFEHCLLSYHIQMLILGEIIMSKEKRDYQYHKNRNSPDSQIHLLIDEYLSPKIRTQGQIRKKLKQRRDLNRVYTILQKRISHASESNLTVISIYFIFDNLTYQTHIVLNDSLLLSSKLHGCHLH